MKLDLHDVPNLMDILRIRSRNTIYEMIRKGELPYVKIGGRYFFRSDDIDKFLQSERRGA